MVAEAHRLGLKLIIDQVLSHTSDQHDWFRQSRASRDNAKADWYVWADAKPDGTAPNNWLSVFGGPAWEWDGGRKQYYLHNFLASQPDLNFHNREVQDALLETVRFWLERGVDGFRLDTVNYYFHDRKLRNNPPLSRSRPGFVLDVNPYGHQQHLHDKTQPENLAFLERFRALIDQYGGRMAVGEVGDEDRSLATVAAYTSGGDRLQMCYTFDLLGPQFSAAHVRKCVSAFEAAVADGWICWAFSNHDVMRHVSRWTGRAATPTRSRNSPSSCWSRCAARSASTRARSSGSRRPSSPSRICATPTASASGRPSRAATAAARRWSGRAAEPNAGFTSGKPWLPIPEAHRLRAADVQEGDAASVLAHYRRALAFRRGHPALVAGAIEFLEAEDDVLAFVRSGEGEKLVCVFNFASAAAQWAIPTGLGALEIVESRGARLDASTLALDGLSSCFARIGLP